MAVLFVISRVDKVLAICFMVAVGRSLRFLALLWSL